MKKIPLRVNASLGTVTDWQGQVYTEIVGVHGDSILFCVAFEEMPLSGTTAMEDMDLTGALALRCQCRTSRIAKAVSKQDLGLITVYNQGDWADEALADGKVSWLFPLTHAAFETSLVGLEYLDVWFEFSWLTPDNQPQTLCQFQVRVYDELDDGAAGTPPPTSPTYLTADEIAAAYVAQSLFDVHASRYRTLWIPAGTFAPRETAGATILTEEYPGMADDITLDQYLFDDFIEEAVQVAVTMPEEWNHGTVKVRVYWASAFGIGESIVWGVAGVAIGDGNVLGAALGSEVLISDDWIDDDTQHITAASAALTVAGTVAAGNMLVLQVARKVGEAGDTVTGDAKFIGVWMQYRETPTLPAEW